MNALEEKREQITDLCLICLKERGMSKDSRTGMLLDMYAQMINIQQDTFLIQNAVKLELAKLNLELEVDLSLVVAEGTEEHTK